MFNNELKILIKPIFDDSQKSINDLNSQLKQLQSKIEQLELKMHIDEKAIKTLGNFSKAIDSYKQIKQELNKVYKEEEKIIKNIDGSIEKNSKKYLQNGEIIEKTTQIIDKRKQAIQQETDILEQQNKTLEKTILNQNKLQKIIINKDAQGNVKNRTELFKDNYIDISYKYDKKGILQNEKNTINLDQQKKTIETLINLKGKLKQELTQLSNEGKISAENLAKLNKAIDNSKNIQQVQRLEQHLKNLNRIRENEHKLELARQQALLNAQRIKTTHGGFVDNRALQQYIESINNLTPRTANLNQQLQKTEMQFKQIAQNAKSAAGATQQAGMSFSEMLSTAMVKFPIWMISATAFYAPIRAMEDIVSRLIQIDTLVTDINRVMDIPNFKLTELLNEAVNASDQLSSKLTDTLKIMGEFGRMGFEENQLVDITKTAQVLQNISDLDATAAVDTLTSAMLNFNITAKDSIKIADFLNEVDNNFAISTRDLSEGLRKSASTAKVFGVELSDLIGYIAAIGSTTRESGSIIGNGLKTIISRITTMSEAETILNSVNISIKDMTGNVKPVSNILGELASKWATLSDEQRQNIGVVLAGRYQLSRFLALMNNWNLAVEATETALNSQGSAMREQIKYADSLEARLNRLDTAWNKVVLSASSAVVTDGFIAIVETLNDVATVSSSMIDKIGLLTGVFGTLGVATILLSTRFRTFATSLIYGTEGITRAQLATAGLTAGMSRLGIATVGATAALRGLAASTFVGLIFAGIGFALEKLIKLYSDAKQKQEEFEQSQQKNIEALTINKEQTEELISSYKALSTEKEKGQWDNTKEKEYLKIQQQLGEIFPNLISHIDSSGQYHLKSAHAIDKEIESTKELIKLKQEEIKLNALKTFDDNIDKIDGFFGLEKQIERKRKQIKELEKIGADSLYVNKMKQELRMLENEFATTSMKINDEVLKVVEAYNKLDINPEIRKSLREFISSFDLTKLNPKELEAFSIKIASLTDKIQKAYENGNKKSFDGAVKALIEYTNQMNITNNQATVLDITFEKVKRKNEQLANVTYAGADGMDAMANAMYDVVENGEQIINIYDQINKQYKETSDKMTVLNRLLQDVASGKQISASEAVELISKVEELANAITIENGKVKVNIQAVEEMRKANKKAYADIVESVKQSLITQTTATINKLKLFSTEIRGLKNVEEAHRLVGEAIDKLNEKIYGARSIQEAMVYEKQKRELEGYTKELDRLANMEKIQTEALNQVGIEQEKVNKSTENAIYISDKYKQALEKINMELEKINAIKAKFPQHSKEYQNALKQEIELLKQQKKIQEEQARDLEKQIQTGKIRKTGLINTSSSVALGGDNASIIWSYLSSKGLSSNVIAGILGNLKLESGLNPNAINKTSGASGIAQWLGSRLTGLKNYADSVGKSWNDLVVQLEYMWKELNSTEKKTLNWLLRNQDASPSTVAEMFDKLFERSGGVGLNNRKKYANEYFSKFTNGNLSISSKQSAETQKDIDEAKSQLFQIKSEIIAIDTKISQIEMELINSQIKGFENLYDKYTSQLKIIDSLAENFSETSEKYRSTLKENKKIVEEQLYINNKEIKFIENLIKNGNLSALVIDELNKKLKELQNRGVELENTYRNVNFNIVQSKIKEFEESIGNVDYYIDRSIKMLSLYEEGTVEWNDEIELQKKLLKEKADLLLEEQKIIKNLMNEVSLSSKQQDELRKTLDKLSLAYWDVINAQNSLMQQQQKQREQLANDVISAIKSSYEKQKYFALKKLDEEVEATREAHNRKIKIYDDELKAFEQLINKKINLIDKQYDEENYDKELNNLQSERKKIEKRISVLSIDNSIEAKAKKIQLEEELTKVLEQIDELKAKRERDLRKENLTDQLSAYKEEIEGKKEAEKEKFDLENKRLEQIRKTTEYHYQNLINNETYYAKIRTDIYNNNFNEIKSILQSFYDDMVEKNRYFVEEMGEDWNELINLINNIHSIQNKISNAEQTISKSKQKDEQLISDWNKYLKNKQIYDSADEETKKQIAFENENFRKRYGFIDGSYDELKDVSFINKDELKHVAWKEYLKNKQLYEITNSKTIKNQLQKENNDLRNFWKFPDGTYEQLKNLKEYHQGGVVGENSSNRLTQLSQTFKKLFNLKPNEEIVKALKGELMIPPLKIPNFINNIQSLNPIYAIPNHDSTNYYLTINIEKFTGTKKETDDLSTVIINNLKKMGRI